MPARGMQLCLSDSLYSEGVALGNQVPQYDPRYGGIGYGDPIADSEPRYHSPAPPEVPKFLAPPVLGSPTVLQLATAGRHSACMPAAA